MSDVSAWELLEGAKINFENFAKMNPQLPIKTHPIWMIAMDQLETGIELLEKEAK